MKGKFVQRKTKSFCYKGLIDKRVCIFKIDTGSDILIINSKLIDSSKQRIPLDCSCCLKYPTGKEVSVESKAEIFIELEKFSVQCL